MTIPDPVPGLVISYDYLWRREAQAGQRHGRKTRPCCVVAAVKLLAAIRDNSLSQTIRSG